MRRLKPSATVAEIHPCLRGHLGHLLYRSAMRLRMKLEFALAPLDLTPACLAVLRIVGESIMSQHDLGLHLEIDKASMVKFIDILEKKRLLQRNTDTQDRRIKLIRLTPKGKAVLRKAGVIYQQTQDNFLSPLKKSERERIHRLLERLLSSQKK